MNMLFETKSKGFPRGDKDFHKNIKPYPVLISDTQIEEIDKNRGSISRSEYIRTLIDAGLDHNKIISEIFENRKIILQLRDDIQKMMKNERINEDTLISEKECTPEEISKIIANEKEVIKRMRAELYNPLMFSNTRRELLNKKLPRTQQISEREYLKWIEEAEGIEDVLAEKN